MALIKCPNCQKEISDKAAACPSCGFVISKSRNLFCGECGNPLSFGATVCSNCGCPVETNADASPVPQQLEVTLNKTKKSKKGIIICIILILAIALGGFSYVKYQSYSYNNTLRETISLIANGAVESEEAGNLIHDVWFNTIFEESNSETDKFTKDNQGEFYEDFNDSIDNLYNDSDFISKISSIKENQEEVIENMKKLTNPPKEYEEAYTAVKTLYDDYMTFSNLVVDPEGSIFDYTDSFNDADEKIGKDLEAVRVYF